MAPAKADRDDRVSAAGCEGDADLVAGIVAFRRPPVKTGGSGSQRLQRLGPACGDHDYAWRAEDVPAGPHKIFYPIGYWLWAVLLRLPWGHPLMEQQSDSHQCE